MGTKTSISLLKDQISLSSNVIQREKLVRALVSTCKINGDEDAFEDVCEYMVRKHRNDQFLVRFTFLSATADNFHLRKLQERHWKHLNVLVHHCLINDDCYWLCKTYFENYIRFCFDKKISYVEYIKLWVEHASYYTYPIFDGDFKYKKMFLEMVGDVLPLCFKDEELKTERFTYIWYVLSWDERHPKQRISLLNNKEIVDTVLQELHNPQHADVIKHFALTYICIDFEKATELNLFEILRNNVNCRTGTCIECLKTAEDEVKIRLMQTLSVMLPSDEFLQILEENRPKNLFEQHPSISKFQKSIPTLFLNIAPAHLAFNSIMQYCQGNYLNYTENVLHQLCNKVAEKRLEGYITSLSTDTVSLKKHSILLALKLMNKTYINTSMKNFMDNEKNFSIRKHLFSSVFQLFLRNPNDHSWQLVMDNIEAISNNENESLCKLATSKRISKQFFVRYLLFTWKTLNMLPFNKTLEEAKSQILNNVTQDNVSLLPNEFCLELIQNNLFQKTHPSLVLMINDFTCKFLIYSDYDYMDQVFSLIKKFSRTSCKDIHNFVKDFCQFFITKKCDKIAVLNSFAVLWDETMKPYESLENYLYIQFTLMSLNNNSIEAVGSKIADICNNLFEIHCLNLRILKNILLNSFKANLLENVEGNFDENYSLLIDSIVKNGNSNATLILALHLIPPDEIFTFKAKIIYDSIIEAAGRNSHPGVQIELYHYLINKPNF
ncbi:hypothetical protein FQR65_LT08194 [Abscondita terminalis]|nr:hypothetical protein FQR65_LT08194 [Abscondita terminalis]